MTTIAEPTSVLSEALLDSCAARTAIYDRENRFFTEDFEELRQAGYLWPRCRGIRRPRPVPGRSLPANRPRLAYRSPATALATNMHLYWTGVAADLYRAGDTSLQWLLEEAAAGEVFAAGHGEAGNDLPLLLSTAQGRARSTAATGSPATRSSAASRPVWTRLGLHAMDTSRPRQPEDRPRLHAARHRRATRSRRPGTRSACAPRAATTPSSTAPSCPDRYIARVLPAGFAGADLFIVAHVRLGRR